MNLLLLFALGLVAFAAAPFAIHHARSAGRSLAWNALDVPVTDYVPAYGSLMYFALDGDTVETVTVAVGAAPAGSVLTDWKQLGTLESGSIQVNVEGGKEIKEFNSTLGKHVPIKTVGETTSLTYSFAVQKITAFILQMSRHAASMNGTTGVIGHNSQLTGHYSGYLLVTQYNGTEQVVTDLVRAELMLSNPMAIHSQEGETAQFSAKLLDNTNNAGALGTVSA